MSGAAFIMVAGRNDFGADYKGEHERMLEILDKYIGKVNGVIKQESDYLYNPTLKFNCMTNFHKDGEWYSSGKDETFDLILEAHNVNSTIKKLKWTNVWGRHWIEFLGYDGVGSKNTLVTNWKVRYHDGISGSAIHEAKLAGRNPGIPIWLNK